MRAILAFIGGAIIILTMVATGVGLARSEEQRETIDIDQNLTEKVLQLEREIAELRIMVLQAAEVGNMECGVESGKETTSDKGWLEGPVYTFRWGSIASGSGTGLRLTSSAGHGLDATGAGFGNSGVIGWMTGTDSYAVRGFHTATGSGVSFGVHGVAGGIGIGNTGINYGVYGSATGAHSINYPIYGSLTGNPGWAGYFDSGSLTGPGVYVRGRIVRTGTCATSKKTSKGYERLWAWEGEDVEFLASGVDVLRNGVAKVEFSRLFKEVTSDKIPIRVLVVPEGKWAPLYIAEKSHSGFTVRVQDGFTTDNEIGFSWFVIARRRGYEQKPDDTEFSRQQIEAEHKKKMLGKR